MESTKFLELVVFEKQRPVDVMLRQGADRNGMNWSTYERLAALTKYIDYGCKFTVLGCKRYRFKSKKEKDEATARWKTDYNGKPHPNSMCCCGGCRYSVGYMNVFNVDSIAKIARYYNDKTGFWREGKGCVLPRKYRSYTCLNHSCAGKSAVAKHLMEAMRMSESQLYRHFESVYLNDKHRGMHSWSIAGIIRFFKSGFEKEKKERRKK